jgi:hypothetical protein
MDYWYIYPLGATIMKRAILNYRPRSCLLLAMSIELIFPVDAACTMRFRAKLAKAASSDNVASPIVYIMYATAAAGMLAIVVDVIIRRQRRQRHTNNELEASQSIVRPSSMSVLGRNTPCDDYPWRSSESTISSPLSTIRQLSPTNMSSTPDAPDHNVLKCSSAMIDATSTLEAFVLLTLSHDDTDSSEGSNVSAMEGDDMVRALCDSPNQGDVNAIWTIQSNAHVYPTSSSMESMAVLDKAANSATV